MNVRAKTVRFLEKITDIDLVSWIWDSISSYDIKSMSNKRKIHKLDFIKVKNFCDLKDCIKKVKRQPKKWEEIFLPSHKSAKGYVSEYVKNSYNLIIKRYITQLNWTKDPNKHFSK